MKSVYLPLLIICIILESSFQPKADSYDVCIYGGTSAGVIAACTAARMGKKVLLIEPGKHLGGLSSGGLGYTDIGNKYAISGLALDFYRRMGKRYGKFEQWIFEPHVAEEVFNEYIKQPGIHVLFNHRIIKVEKIKGYIQQIIIENSTYPKPATNKIIPARMFIDCSYEGDLMAKAGVSYTTGRESNSTYNEKYNGVQLMEGHQFPDGIDPYNIKGDSTSGLLWGITNGMLQPAGTGDKKIQTYNYRICLTDDPGNKISITRPEGYDSTKYELLLRLFSAQPGKRTLNDYFIFSKMPNRKTDINNRGGFSTDMIGMNYDYPEGDYAVRTSIINQHKAYTKGLLYFYGHDKRVPSSLQKEMLQWGYPKDEYKDNGNWSPQLYIRESRRMTGAYVMTQANCEGSETVTDGIGMAAYTMDSHNCQRIVVDGMVKNEGNVEKGGFGPYPVSYRSIIPKEIECKNLYVPVCLSASHIAYGSIRMEPVFMELAQSAAVAACFAIDKNQPVQQANIKLIQNFLKQNPLSDGSTPEVLVDNEDKRHVTITGNWNLQTKGSYGPSLLMLEQSGNTEGKVQFKPSLIKEGKYSIYVYVPKVPHSSDQTIYTVFDGKAEKKVVIHPNAITIEGQTTGEWISLGVYKLPKGESSYVSISSENANGVTVADAILFIPVN